MNARWDMRGISTWQRVGMATPPAPERADSAHRMERCHGRAGTGILTDVYITAESSKFNENNDLIKLYEMLSRNGLIYVMCDCIHTAMHFEAG